MAGGVRPGTFWCGPVWFGEVRQGRHGLHRFVRLMLGKARYGRQGTVRCGKAMLGLLRHVKAGVAWQVAVRYGRLS